MTAQQHPAVFIGLDVGKAEHHAVALTAAGKKVYDKALPNDETRLRGILDELARAHGPALLVVDQPATIGALPVAVAQACDGVEVAYLPGLAMRRIADLHPGSAKTDAKDAAIIAEAARTMPHTLRSIRVDEEQIAELAMLAGFDDDLAAQITATSNRLRGLLTQIHPALERVFPGGTLSTDLVLELLEKFGGPTGFTSAGRGRVLRFARSHSRRDPSALVEKIFTALSEQTVTVPATAAVELVIPRVAGQVKELKAQRATVAHEVEAMLEDFPLASVLMSMPGIGIKTAAQILLAIGDGTGFETAGHLAAYAGIAPITRRSGTSIRG
ncbi:MAG: IS110 family transposase, partial [Micrococcus luteus]